MAKRRRGGQELPDELQDRPEQNRGYDETVESGQALDTRDALETESLERDPTDEALSQVDDDIELPADPDEAAERDAAREVRRRERTNR
jgi:hypothetical protein